MYKLDDVSLKNLVYIFYMMRSGMTAGRILNIWERTKVFKEYQKPDLETLKVWIAEMKVEAMQIIKDHGSNNLTPENR